MERRDFLRMTAAGSSALAAGAGQAGALQAAGAGVGPSQAAPPTGTASTGTASTGMGDRAVWVGLARRLADPVLTNLARGTLRSAMPVEEAAGANRAPVTHLEAVGRLLAGLAPWLELPTDGATDEGRLRAQYVTLAQQGLAHALDPASPDRLNFTDGGQPLVDAAFLAHAVLRAPRVLRDTLAAATRARLTAALESTRRIQPGFNNWLLFAAMVEAALARLGAGWDRMRVDYALRQHEQWYKGDGLYGDGPELHWDYYNSFVIQPMLLDVLDAVGDQSPAWQRMKEPVAARARRYASILERLIAPDGSFPPIGRSIAYRAGAFQALAQAALRRALDPDVLPAQVRGALTAVLRRTLEAPQTFDAGGWLRIGLAGHQPGVGERYISTGSLYLCATALLPLGLPPGDPFWSAPAEPWTSQRAWSGAPFPIDHALGG
jgi:hypothetical protein